MDPADIPAGELAARLRRLELPVIGYLSGEKLFLDMRTIGKRTPVYCRGIPGRRDPSEGGAVMHNVIIGTAGLLIMGKTTLIRALTGRDTDRLEEEKKEGSPLISGLPGWTCRTADAPGSLMFPGMRDIIHNMAAGVAGMDLVLLVIAADEGVMPQTREHMDILSLLGVEHYIIVLNKCDLVDGEWLDMVESEIREEMQETALKDAPVVRVSASDGSGGFSHYNTKEEVDSAIKAIKELTE